MAHSKMKNDDGFAKWATLMTLIYESNEPHTKWYEGVLSTWERESEGVGETTI